MLVFAIAFSSLCQDSTDGAALLERLERALEEAKSVSLQFEGTLKDSDKSLPYSGTIRVKGGGKILVAFSFVQGDRKNELRIQSDGSKVVIDHGKESRRTEECPRDLTRFVLRGIGRMGMFELCYSLGRLGEGSKKANQNLAELPLSMDSSVTDGKEGGKILGSVFAYAAARKPHKRGATKLWLDADTLTPLQRSSEYTKDDPMFVFTETYEGFSTEEIPDSEFEID